MEEEEAEEGYTLGSHQAQTSTVLRPPKRYRVLLHNDDVTTMDFVVGILMSVFHKTVSEAQRIMFQVHNEEVACCGVYIFEVAEVKSDTVKRKAKNAGYPLHCSIEED